MSSIEVVALVLAGGVAGAVGSAGGITSLVSYPALLAVGLSPHHASIANNVALVACWPGSAMASRSELRGWTRWLRRLLPVAVAGGGAGAALLLVTPAAAFDRIVPFLVILGSFSLLFEPWLTRWQRRHSGRGGGAALVPALLVLSVYNGYFGAGSGVMVLTLVLVLADEHLPTSNALKNMLIGASCAAAAGIYVIVGPAQWTAVAPLAGGMLVGSNLGPRIARRIPKRLLRLLIVLLGLALAVYLLLDASA